MRTEWQVRPLKRNDWPMVEALFGERGACGGCWCMFWRLPRGGKLWEEMKGEKNRAAFREEVESGKAIGVLAFDDDKPIGWCRLGQRQDFPRLNRSRWIHKDWQPGTWAVVCFYIITKYRRKGVAAALLDEAIQFATTRGALILEAYPAPDRWGKEPGKIPPAFAYTGTRALYESAGFEETTPKGNSRPTYHLKLG